MRSVCGKAATRRPPPPPQGGTQATGRNDRQQRAEQHTHFERKILMYITKGKGDNSQYISAVKLDKTRTADTIKFLYTPYKSEALIFFDEYSAKEFVQAAAVFGVELVIVSDVQQTVLRVQDVPDAADGSEQ